MIDRPMSPKESCLGQRILYYRYMSLLVDAQHNNVPDWSNVVCTYLNRASHHEPKIFLRVLVLSKPSMLRQDYCEIGGNTREVEGVKVMRQYQPDVLLSHFSQISDASLCHAVIVVLQRYGVKKVCSVILANLPRASDQKY